LLHYPPICYGLIGVSLMWPFTCSGLRWFTESSGLCRKVELSRPCIISHKVIVMTDTPYWHWSFPVRAHNWPSPSLYRP
jgi:hypothetical protein